jgi:hypothetical protein
MKYFNSLLSLSLFSSLIFANPISIEIIAKRELTETEKRGQCPQGGTLSGNYLTPTGVYKVSRHLPNQHFPNSPLALVTPNDFCTIFNLVIPPTGVGKTCTLEFLFPSFGEALDPYIFFGPGHFTFTGYAFGSGANDTTTYNHQPPPGPSPPFPPPVITPGAAYTINVGGCGIQPGMSGLGVSGMLCSTDTTFLFLQTTQLGCPFGFYVSIT